jgi:hypothetical protein
LLVFGLRLAIALGGCTALEGVKDHIKPEIENQKSKTTSR